MIAPPSGQYFLDVPLAATTGRSPCLNQALQVVLGGGGPYKTAQALLICSAEIFNSGEIWALTCPLQEPELLLHPWGHHLAGKEICSQDVVLLQIVNNLPRLLTFPAFALTLSGSAAESQRAAFRECAKKHCLVW